MNAKILKIFTGYEIDKINRENYKRKYNKREDNITMEDLINMRKEFNRFKNKQISTQDYLAKINNLYKEGTVKDIVNEDLVEEIKKISISL